jgi:hypothetical protein
MKQIIFWLLLLGISGVALVSSCKSDEVDPIDMLLRFYCGGGDIESIKLERKKGKEISIKAKNVLYKLDANGEFYKDFEFPNCEIAIIDTTIEITSKNANQQQFYAIITNKDNNTVFGEI